MTNANVGTQGLTWALLGSEAIAVLYDLLADAMEEAGLEMEVKDESE